MKENFTAQQREIVARKMGYNGPMDMFDDYLASTPSDANKYSNITAKLAERMAKGGMVKKRRYAIGGVVDDTATGGGGTTYSDQQIKDAIATSKAQGFTDAQIIQGAGTNFGVAADRVTSLMGGATTGAVTGATTGAVTGATTGAVTGATTGAVTGATTGAVTGATTGVTDWDAYYKQYPGTAPTTPEMAAAQKRVLAQSAAGTTTTAYTDQQIRDAIAASKAQGFTDAQILEGAAAKYGVSSARMAALMGTSGSSGTSSLGVTTSTTGAPVMTTAPSYTAAQTGTTGIGGTVTNQAATTAATASAAAAASQAGATKTITADTITPETSLEDIKKYLKELEAAQGIVSKDAQATAAEKTPLETAVSTMQGATGTAAKVTAPEERKLLEAEKISGTAVDMTEVDKQLAKLQAEQGTVTDESTTTGQLNKLMKNFDAGNPPPWAAASMRTAMATLAARGLGASSLAGQAIVQAALEAATPIATSDAAVYQKMNEQNLSNKQAVAVLIGEQRAKFLGQSYDQAYDAKVKNAATISEIANKNFDAKVTIAIENSRLANSMNIAQLSADNAVALAKIAQVATLETTNLNNRQQVAVENAKAFLAMDLKNLDNTQQTKLFVAQRVVDSIVSDAALAQAAKATNATNKLDADKITAQLELTASTFNAGEKNRVSIANSATANDIAKFNAQEANNRDQFNAKMASEVSVANAKIMADISTANTAATNAALAVASKNATDLASVVYAQESQTFRDKLELSWKSGENMLDRATNIATATITGNAATSAANIKAASDASAAIGKLAGTIVLDWMGIPVK